MRACGGAWPGVLPSVGVGTQGWRRLSVEAVRHERRRERWVAVHPHNTVEGCVCGEERWPRSPHLSPHPPDAAPWQTGERVQVAGLVARAKDTALHFTQRRPRQRRRRCRDDLLHLQARARRDGGSQPASGHSRIRAVHQLHSHDEASAGVAGAARRERRDVWRHHRGVGEGDRLDLDRRVIDPVEHQRVIRAADYKELAIDDPR